MDCKLKWELMAGERQFLVCPVCGSGNIVHAGVSNGWAFPGVHTAQRYICKDCGYEGSVILEVDSPEEIEKIKSHYKNFIKGNKKRVVHVQPIFTKKHLWFWRALVIGSLFSIPYTFIVLFLGLHESAPLEVAGIGWAVSIAIFISSWRRREKKQS